MPPAPPGHSCPDVVCEPWPLVGTCLPDTWPCNPAGWSCEQRAAVDVAQAILTKAIAGAYGLCRVTVRPCRWRDCQDYLPMGVLPDLSSMPYPVLHEGRVFNVQCGCGPICEVLLDGPVHDIVEVRVDGHVVDPSSYRVDDHRRLVRQGCGCAGSSAGSCDGECCWPACNELGKPDGAPGTWSVTYRRGVAPGPDAQLALTLLALETAKACRGKSCALSDRVTRVVREGIEIELDTLEEIRRGSTGIPFVDRFIALTNPYRAAAPMRVWSPDIVRGRRTTWTAPTHSHQGPHPGPHAAHSGRSW